MTVTLHALPDGPGLQWAQRLVTEGHYLHRPVDARCSVFAYLISVRGLNGGRTPAGCLIFGRPEATRCQDWYGSVEDVREGRCAVTRWQVLNLARVYILPEFQRGGTGHSPDTLPGYVDRKGVFRSTLVSTAIKIALDRVVVDYLLARPPCFPDEPYQLDWVLSYCDTSLHKGTVYRTAGFELYRANERGIQTWRKRVRALSRDENAAVLLASERSTRSRRYRAARGVQQMAFAQEGCAAW